MGKLSEDSLSRLMLLLVSDSGMGKTGSLASLAKAGYNLRILDVDNGTAIVRNLLKDDPAALERVYVEKCLDTFKNVNGRILPKTPLKAWPRISQLLSHWKVGTPPKEQRVVLAAGTSAAINLPDTPLPASPDYYDLGPITSWTNKEILVIDSLTHAGEAAMRYHQSLNGKLGTHPTLPDWGIVQTMIKELLEMLKDSEVKCHVIVITHIDWRYRDIMGGKDNDKVVGRELEGGYPSAPGNKLPEKVGSYFNDALQVVATGSGSALRRKITTVPLVSLGLKTSNPFEVKKEYPLDTGLADYFKDTLG